MKKAREIVIPDDGVITLEEYNDYSQHAFASSSWYATNYARNSNQIRDKLYRKGYPSDEVTVKLESGEVMYKNMVEDTVERLIESLLIDDRHYAESVARSQVRQGNGMSKVRSMLMQKKVDSDLISEVIEELDLDDEIVEAVARQAERVIRSSQYQKIPEGWARQQKLTQKLLAKGFSFDDISRWKENQEQND